MSGKSGVLFAIRKKMRKVSEIGLAKLKKKAQDTFNHWVTFTRGKCEANGEGGRNCSGVLQCAHIKPVGAYPSMRFDEDNVLSLCYSHHMFWAHKDPIGFSDFVEKHIGKEKFYRLKERSESYHHKWNREDLERIISKYSL